MPRVGCYSFVSMSGSLSSPRVPIALCALALLLSAGSAAALEARIGDVTVSREASQLQVSFQLLDAFDQEVLDRIQSGLPTGFTYDIKLERLRKWWFDPALERSRVEVLAMYNAVTREYLVNLKQDGKLIDSRVVKNEDELRETMTIFHQLPFCTMPDVRGRLVVRLRARLGSRTILALFPTTIHTAWAESETLGNRPAR